MCRQEPWSSPMTMLLFCQILSRFLPFCLRRLKFYQSACVLLKISPWRYLVCSLWTQVFTLGVSFFNSIVVVFWWLCYDYAVLSLYFNDCCDVDIFTMIILMYLFLKFWWSIIKTVTCFRNCWVEKGLMLIPNWFHLVLGVVCMRSS